MAFAFSFSSPFRRAPTGKTALISQLADLLAPLLPPAKGLVIELAPTASGLVTTFLAGRRQQPQDLLVVTPHAGSAARLARLLPQVEVLHGDFLGSSPALHRLIDAAPFTARAIVSRLKVPRDIAYQYRLLQSGFQLLALDGQFIQIQAGSAAPFPEPVLQRLRLKMQRHGTFASGGSSYTVWQVSRT